MNPFAAAVILSQVPLDVFLYEMDAETRLAQFGNLVGEGRIVSFTGPLRTLVMLRLLIPAPSPTFTEMPECRTCAAHRSSRVGPA